MRPLDKNWRSGALRIVVYLDDGQGVCATKDICLRQFLLVLSDLISSRFVPNKDKCMWIPSQLLRWLGFHWDFVRRLLSIPEDKISVFLASIREVLVLVWLLLGCWLRLPGVSFPVCMFLATFARL